MSPKRHRGSRGQHRSKKAPSLSEQAKRWIQARANRGQTKSSGKPLRSDRTVNRYIGDLTRAAHWIEQRFGITRLNGITQTQAQAYIDFRAQQSIRAATLQGYGMALKTLPQVSQLSLPSKRTEPNNASKPSRAYTFAQIKAIQSQLPLLAQLSVQILLESGCRAQDLASIRLASEAPLIRAQHARLHPERFTGREDWITVKFIGKGGHEYLSTLSPNTIKQLQRLRLPHPIAYRDRGQDNAVCQQYYDLPAGNYLSKLWTLASKQVLDYSHGIHGLRHTYAQQRVTQLQDTGMSWQLARECVSQTMGHYRAKEVDTYLR
jgi:integrase